MIKLVIFDLDGTLIDSLNDLADASNKALAECGYPPHAVERYRFFVGNGVIRLIECILPENARTEDNIRKVHEGFDKYYSQGYNVHTRPYKGIRELLDHLHEQGIMTAVASNKPDGFTQLIVKEMLGDSFDCVCGKKDGFEKKPDPGIIFHIMEKLGVSPEEVLLAGDSDVDIHTAHNAHIKSIGCTWGFRPREELEEAGADNIVDSPDKILSIAAAK